MAVATLVSLIENCFQYLFANCKQQTPSAATSYRLFEAVVFIHNTYCLMRFVVTAKYCSDRAAFRIQRIEIKREAERDI